MSFFVLGSHLCQHQESTRPQWQLFVPPFLVTLIQHRSVHLVFLSAWYFPNWQSHNDCTNASPRSCVIYLGFGHKKDQTKWMKRRKRNCSVFHSKVLWWLWCGFCRIPPVLQKSSLTGTSFHFKELMRQVISVTFLFSHHYSDHDCVKA